MAGPISATDKTLTIPCVVEIDLDGKDLSVRNVVIEAGQQLTIRDSSGGGSLTADASATPDTAGIETTSATLCIHSGIVNAIAGQIRGSAGAAAIGGRSGAAGGTVTITGGTVNATNNPNGDNPDAAAIGGGSNGAGGTVTITGGTVNAGNPANAAGIGGGRAGDGATVTITGGTVAAVGIGGGDLGSAGTILITGGTITATAVHRAAAIGAHRRGTGGSVTITGGTVDATGGNRGAGIGTGEGAAPLTVTISGGVVMARGAGEGAGIGGGDGVPGGTITISGGTVTAIGASGAAGIGGGGNGGAGGVISIAGGSGGVVTATAGSAEADPIGAGKNGAEGDLTVDDAAVDSIDGLTRTITFPAGATNPDSSSPAEPCEASSVQTESKGSSTVPVDPTRGPVEAAVAAAVASGVAGTSAAVLVRGGEVAPVGSALSAGTGPRGGVVVSADGLQVSLASTGGVAASSGVVVTPGAALEVSIVSDLVPGSVVEAWGYSTPRLLGAVRVPDGFAPGDAVLLPVPTGAPLDGGAPLDAGAHVLQLRMETASGLEVLATGMTVGGPVPTSVPTGEGPQPPALQWWLLLAFALGVLVALGVRPGWPGLRVR